MSAFRIRFGSPCSTYRVLLCLGVVSGMASLGYGIMNQSAIPPYVREIGLVPHMGVIWAAFLVVETVCKSPMGSLGDRIGRRPLIAGGAMVSCIAAAGMTQARELTQILVVQALNGLAAAAIWPTIAAALSGCMGSQRCTAMSVMTVTYIAGLALGPFVGGIANDLTDSRLTSFYLVSALFLLTALASMLLVPAATSEEEAVERPSARFRIADLVVGLRAMPDMMVLALVAFFGIGLLVPIAKLFAMDEFGMTETAYGGLVLPVSLGVAVVSLVSGRLGDRWGKARSVRLGVGISALAMWTITMSDHIWQLAVAGMFLGIGFVLAMPAWLALVSEMSSPWVRGAVIGALGTAQGVGAVSGAALGAYLYKMVSFDIWGIGLAANSHYSPFILSAIVLTICLGLTLIFVREGDTRRIELGQAGSPM